MAVEHVASQRANEPGSRHRMRQGSCSASGSGSRRGLLRVFGRGRDLPRFRGGRSGDQADAAGNTIPDGEFSCCSGVPPPFQSPLRPAASAGASPASCNRPRWPRPRPSSRPRPRPRWACDVVRGWPWSGRAWSGQRADRGVTQPVAPTRRSIDPLMAPDSFGATWPESVGSGVSSSGRLRRDQCAPGRRCHLDHGPRFQDPRRSRRAWRRQPRPRVALPASCAPYPPPLAPDRVMGDRRGGQPVRARPP
jgi:hypothetical protein